MCIKKTGEVCKVDENECKADEISPQWYKIAGIGFFYIAILIVGVYATRQGKKKRRPSMDLAEDSMVAGRNIGVVVGVFTARHCGHCWCMVCLNDAPTTHSFWVPLRPTHRGRAAQGGALLHEPGPRDRGT